MPASPKIAAIGACGLRTVMRTDIDLRKARQDRVGDRAAGGFDQAIVARREHFGRGVDDGAVGNRVGEPVGARAGRQIERQFEIDDEALADLGFVLHHAVMGVDQQAGDEDRVAHRARFRSRRPCASACTVSATSCTRTIAAPPATASRCDGDRSAQPAIGRRRRYLVDEALARRADQERQAEFLQFREPRDHRQALFRRHAKADAGIEHDIVARDAGAVGNLERALEEGGDVGHDVGGIRLFAVVHHHHRHADGRATTRAMSGSRCRPQTSLTIAAPARSAQSATLAFMVSIETGTPSATTAGSTGFEAAHFVVGRHRLHAAVGAGQFCADVDDVGAVGDHLAGMRDAAIRGSINLPPSENESGVTLRMPITSVRPRASMRRHERRRRRRASGDRAGGAHGGGFARSRRGCQATWQCDGYGR